MTESQVPLSDLSAPMTLAERSRIIGTMSNERLHELLRLAAEDSVALDAEIAPLQRRKDIVDDTALLARLALQQRENQA